MKNRLKSTLFFAAAATLALFAGCEKDPKPFAAGGDVQTFFSVVRPTEEAFSIVAEQGGAFTSAQKSFIAVPPNAFVTQAGLPVTGTVSVVFYEVKKKGDMIRFNLPTITTDRQVLESGGMVFFGASQAGQLLNLKPGKRIEIVQQTDEPAEDMTLFLEAFSSADFGWALMPDSISGNVNLTDSPDTTDLAGYGFQYYIDTTYIWINCDRFLGLPASELTNVSAALTENFTHENTAVYLIFNEINSVIRLWPASGEPNIFSGQNFPPGSKVTFLAVAVSEDGALFFDEKTATISVGLQVELSPKKTSLEKIKDSLDDLP